MSTFDVSGTIYLMRRMDPEAAEKVAKGILSLLEQRPFLKRDISGGDLAYLESFGKQQYSEEGPHSINKPPRIEANVFPAQYRRSGDLAAFYAANFNDYVMEGGFVSLSEREDAAEEMLGYSVEFDGDRFQAVMDVEVIRFSAEHWAPFTGERSGKGWRHKRTKQVVYGDRNPGESAAERQKSKATKEHARPEKLLARLSTHAEANPLDSVAKASASRAYRSLYQHHGPHLVYRIGELADDLESAHSAAKDPERKAGFGKRLASLHHMLSLYGSAEQKSKRGEPERFEENLPPTKRQSAPPAPQKPFPVSPSAISAHPPIDAHWFHKNPHIQKLIVEPARILASKKFKDSKGEEIGSTSPSLVTLHTGTRGVFKPVLRERTVRENVPNNSGGREAAAWELARHTGRVKVPETVFRELGGGGFGSLQRYVPKFKEIGANPGSLERHSDEDIIHGAIHDLQSGNTDSHDFNIGDDANGDLVKIDHGYAFPNGHEGLKGTWNYTKAHPENNTHVLSTEAVRRNLKIPDYVAGDLDKIPEIDTSLKRLGMTQRERNLTEWRIRILAKNAGKPLIDAIKEMGLE